MHRRITVAAGLLAAVTSTAFAAGIDVNGTSASIADIASGAVSVDDCTGGLDLDVVPGARDAASGDWHLDHISVTGTADLPVVCEGFTIVAAITVEGRPDPVIATLDGLGEPAPLTNAMTFLTDPAEVPLLGAVVQVDLLVDHDPTTVVAAPAPPPPPPPPPPPATSGADLAGASTAPTIAFGPVSAAFFAPPTYTTTGLDLFAGAAACPVGAEPLARWLARDGGAAPDALVDGWSNEAVGLGTPDAVVLVDAGGTVLATGSAGVPLGAAIPTGTVYAGARWCLPSGTTGGPMTDSLVLVAL